MIKVKIIGNGSVGKKRAEAIQHTKGILTDYDEADVIIVCVPPKYHKDLTIKALRDGKHVLCEKPLATNVKDAQKMADVAKKTGKFLKVGSNHRYFDSVQEALKKDIGKIISFNGSIGHNGERIKNTWYWDKEISGGGTLIDNGWHLIDLARLFMGDFIEVNGIVSNNFWLYCKVEDIASVAMVSKKGGIAVINSSWGKIGGYMEIQINGIKGRIEIGDTKDRNSLVRELNYFFKCIKNNVQPEPSGEDGIEILKIIEQVYGNH